MIIEAESIVRELDFKPFTVTIKFEKIEDASNFLQEINGIEKIIHSDN